jgi:O-antigen ligase
VLGGVLAGIAVVAVASLAVLAVSHGDAVLSATTGAGWRFRGIGQNPNTVPMLLSIGMPIAVWRSLEGPRRLRLTGVALVLLFAGEIAFSGSRGAIIAAFGGAVATALALGRAPGTKLAVSAGLCALALACVALSKLPSPAKVADNPVPQESPARATRGIDAEHVVRLEDEIGFPSSRAYIPPARRTVFGESGRAQAWDGALHQGGKRPIVGYGFGTEDSVFADRFYAFEGGFVENTYLGLFLQLGATGVALLVALLAALAWSAARLVRRSPRGGSGPAAAALGVLLAAILIGGTQSGLLSVGNIAASSIWICVLTLPVLARESLP